MENNEQASNPDAAVQDAVLGSSSDDYFDALDKEVNGVVRDDSQEQQTVEATQEATPDPIPEVNQDNTAWKKRYSDSSAEAQRMANELRELAPLKPLMNVMKRDSGLVDTIKGYLNNGGATPKSVTEELNLDDDFVYDAHEAVTSPDSKSAKVFNTMVDKAVNQKVNNVLTREKQIQAKQIQQSQAQKEAEDFKARHNMSDEDFKIMMDKAKSTKFTLDDMHLLLNKTSANNNVAQSTKKDMLSQMNNMRDIPTSQANVNSAPQGEENPDDKVFDTLLGMDKTFDELFG